MFKRKGHIQGAIPVGYGVTLPSRFVCGSAGAIPCNLFVTFCYHWRELMRLIARLTAVCLVGIVTFGSIAHAVEAPSVPRNPAKTIDSEPARATKRQEELPIIFRHGDISWLPELAAEAGWPQRTWKRLGYIILRESGGCPNRAGGDAVDKLCNITHVTEWNHRSDTGLLQINGVNYDITRNKWAVVCRQMNICEQGPLFDPLTNLKAGLLLWEVAGWDPWRRS